MRSMFLKYALVFVLMLGSGVMLMDVSHQVQKAERDIRKADRAIEREQEHIRVLRAEWAYLNDPARLERLAVNGLGLSLPAEGAVVSKVPSSAVFLPDEPLTSSDDQGPSDLYVEISYPAEGVQ